MFAVVDAEPGGDGMTGGSAEGEGGEELSLRHFEGAGGEDEGGEGHGGREDGGEGDGDEGVVLHPSGDAFEDARGHVFLEELHAAGVSDLVAEVSADRGAEGGGEHEEEEAGVLRGEEDEHDVGDAGDGEGDEGGVDDGDEEDADEAVAEEEVDEGVAVRRGGEPKGAGVEGWEAGGGKLCGVRGHRD